MPMDLFFRKTIEHQPRIATLCDRLLCSGEHLAVCAPIGPLGKSILVSRQLRVILLSPN